MVKKNNINGRIREGERDDFVHTGPGTLAGRYLRRFGNPFTFQNITQERLYRSRYWEKSWRFIVVESTPRVITNDRPHRLSVLNTGWTRERLFAVVHGWRFDESGGCETAREPKPFCHKIPRLVYPTCELHGLIFAYFGEGDPPVFPPLPESRRVSDNWTVSPSAEMIP